MSEWIWEIYLDIFNRKVNSVTSVLIRLVSVCLSFSYGSEMLHNRSRSRNCHQVRDLSRGVLLLKINFHNTILMFRLSCNCWYFFTSDTDSHGLSHQDTPRNALVIVHHSQKHIVNLVPITQTSLILSSSIYYLLEFLKSFTERIMLIVITQWYVIKWTLLTILLRLLVIGLITLSTIH